MTALVIAEHDNAAVKGATLNTVTAAAACGGDVHVLIAGHNAAGAAAAAAQIAGVSKVIHADAEYLAHGLAENMAAQVLAIAATGGGSGNGIECGAFDGCVVVFSNNESGHDQITFATFLSLSTSVATSGTLMPAPRLAGSSTLRVFRRGATSTPRSSGLTMSSCFFLAFMMLGKVT